MPDRGDLGVCNRPGCDGEGEHELRCYDCDVVVGYLCSKHMNQLQRDLENGGRRNEERITHRNEEANAED